MLYHELQPVDTYSLKLSTPFSDYDRQLLTLLYQPLTGPEAMGLFSTMLADVDVKESHEFTHYHLMNILTMPLKTIFQARISLEAIGLLRTFTRTVGDQRSFVYELLAPLDAKNFFQDPLLATFLFSKIGEQSYRDLRARFATGHPTTSGYAEISRTFMDVYTPVNSHAYELQNDQELSSRTRSTGIPFEQSLFDFNLLMSGLSEQMVPRAALAGISRELIAKLAFMYALNPLDMQKIIMIALDENLEVPEDRLRKAAKDFYKMNISKTPPKLEKTYHVEGVQQEYEGPKTKDRELVDYFESTSPREMLLHLTGKEPLPVDVQLAENLVNGHGLKMSVVNVLLQYILLRNDMKITTSFAQRIASHWALKEVDTAEKAMEIARQEHDQYTKWMSEGGKSSKGTRKPTREEPLPDWFYKKEEKKEPKKPTIPENKDDIDEKRKVDEKRKTLLAKLESMRNGVN
ncbi:helicase DnaB [Sporosarcina sp. BI001-red]|uniref:replication initiation and membrane attachment family protein n=1 Tax=Sporosarcina sp. BI001-red TaxID=2282866 RepID=UPI000E21D145|nr:DnaD domain protein [Sporosarcina sp. BI001-red]REB06571.1 helicase DnaB [Sporosarcina sp. BI001-red]